MSTSDIHKISIKQYLAENNIHPIKDRGYYSMYRSPFRNENDASFKVDYHQNLWFDFGSGEGGSIIDLVMKMKHCSLHEAMTQLENGQKSSDPFSFQREDIIPKPNTTGIILKVLPLSNRALIEYLQGRKINIETAKSHCKEVYYAWGDKRYFAVGFRNDSGGYEVRNKYFKGCTSKDITTIIKGTDCCAVFEGFIDYLSFLTMKRQQYPQTSIVVLNSLVNISKAADFLSRHESIHAYLDNDEAGKRATCELKTVCKNLSDQSEHYRNHKDLNEFLCSQNCEKGKQQRKGLWL